MASTLRMLSILAALLYFSGTTAACPGELRVVVVVILATDQHEKIDPRLTEIAAEVKKREPTLTGFEFARMINQPVKVGQREIVKLIEDKTLTVTLEKGPDADDKVRLTVRPPTLGEITYTCKTDKYLPIVTRHITKDKSRLIVAVMVKSGSAK